MGLNVLQELSAEQNKFQAEIRGEELKYKSHILDLTLPTDDPKYLFSIGGVPTIPAGELIGVKGRAKMGKSQFEYILVATMLAGISRGEVRPLQDRYKILLFDTEQSKVSLKKCCQRALRYAGLPIGKNDVRFLPFFMRPLSIEERRTTIENAVREEQPDIIFIDGVRDLLQDFNNLAESNDLIQWLMQLTAEHGCTIVSVLHQNKSKDDGNMRGHLGTELLNKLTDCFEVSRKDGKFIVSCSESRNVQCGDLSFSIDAEGNFQEETSIKEDKGLEFAKEIQDTLKLCFAKQEAYGRNELIRAYSLESAKSESTAKRRVEIAKIQGFIQVGSDEKYHLSRAE